MKVQNPIIGRAKGSAGGMTFSKVYDKNVARAKAFEVNNPKTQAQQTQRAFFADLTALCSDFSDEQLRFLFPQKPKTMSRRNALTKQIAESYYIDGTTKSIDFSDIITLGNAPVLDFGSINLDVSNTTVVVSLDGISGKVPHLIYNDMVAVLLNATKKSISLTTNSSIVDNEEISIPLPSGWADSDEIYAIPLICNSEDGAIESKGFGAVGVINRPPRKNG